MKYKAERIKEIRSSIDSTSLDPLKPQRGDEKDLTYPTREPIYYVDVYNLRRAVQCLSSSKTTGCASSRQELPLAQTIVSMCAIKARKKNKDRVSLTVLV